MKKLVCASEVEALVKKGQKVYYIAGNTIITPAARDAANTLGVEFMLGCPNVETNDCKDSAPQQKEDDCKDIISQQKSDCKGDIDSNIIYKALKAIIDSGLLKGDLNPIPKAPFAEERDASGLKIVRGKTVTLEDFDTGVPSNKVFYRELISKEDAPMSAGFLVIDESSFDWEMFYDEIDFIIEGTVTVTLNGKTFAANQGDVLLVPKGSKVKWGSTGHTKLFYVTFPANWPDLMPQ
jgi:ethanolamine utilization protein EutQ